MNHLFAPVFVIATVFGHAFCVIIKRLAACLISDIIPRSQSHLLQSLLTCPVLDKAWLYIIGEGHEAFLGRAAQETKRVAITAG